MTPERKTGQSIDSLKEQLVIPKLTNAIITSQPLNARIALLDIGSGDGSSCEAVIDSLKAQNISLTKLALLDIDTKILLKLALRATQISNQTDTALVEPSAYGVRREFIKLAQDSYDVATFQLGLHQITNPYQASLVMHDAFECLKPNGDFFVVDLHPEYLYYLGKNHPEKLSVTTNSAQELTATYHFDSGGQAPIATGSLATQISYAIGTGFDLQTIQDIGLDTYTHPNERQKTLIKKGIPTFYLAHFKKSSIHERAHIEGEVKSTRVVSDNWIEVTFTGNETFTVPKTKNWQEIKPHDILILQEVMRTKEDIHLLNYWNIAPDNKISGTQIITTSQPSSARNQHHV